MVGQNLQNQASDVRSTKTFEGVQELKDATDQIIEMLDDAAERSKLPRSDYW